jgi:hypothetical protein
MAPREVKVSDVSQVGGSEAIGARTPAEAEERRVGFAKAA